MKIEHIAMYVSDLVKAPRVGRVKGRRAYFTDAAHAVCAVKQQISYVKHFLLLWELRQYRTNS